MNNREIKLAFLGCGLVSDWHLEAINEVTGFNITTAIDIDTQKANNLSQKTGARVFTSFEEALEKGDFEAVDIMLPHNLHEGAAVQSFQIGKHVLLEKPISTTIESSLRILNASKQAGTVFMVAENAQYWPEIVETKRLIDLNVIGDVLTARAALWARRDQVRGLEEPGLWRFKKEQSGGGMALDGASHWIRPLRMWLGEIDEVVAGVDHTVEGMEGESLIKALLKFQSGRVGNLDVFIANNNIKGPEYIWRVSGTKGELLLPDKDGILLFNKDYPKGELVFQPQGYPRSFNGEFEDFRDAILFGKQPAAEPEMALGELRVALAIYKSVESRRWEKVW